MMETVFIEFPSSAKLLPFGVLLLICIAKLDPLCEKLCLSRCQYRQCCKPTQPVFVRFRRNKHHNCRSVQWLLCDLYLECSVWLLNSGTIWPLPSPGV